MSLLSLDNTTLSFGGITALYRISLSVSPGAIHSIIGPNGAGKTSIFNGISGVYHPQQGKITFEGRDITRLAPHRRAPLGIARTFQNIELFRGMTVLDNLMLGRHCLMKTGILSGGLFLGRAAREEVAPPPAGRGDHRLPGDPAHPQEDRRHAGLRPAEAGRAGPGAGPRTEAAAARRADGRHEPGGDRGHGPLHPRHQRGDGGDRPADRARHGRGHGHLRPR